MSQLKIRTGMLERLALDLLGPRALDEVIRDRPTDRYMTGILHPQESEIGQDEDEDLEGGDGGSGVRPAEPNEGVPLVFSLKPSSAGISFCVNAPGSADANVDVSIRCGTYEQFYVDDEGGESKKRSSREQQRWRRRQHDITLAAVALTCGSQSIDLSAEGLEGAELYLQVADWVAPTKTVTAAVVNRNQRGESRVESEERSFFQVELEVKPGAGCRFSPRPSGRKSLDEDDLSAELIYRNAPEFAVGHSCAAQWKAGAGQVHSLRTTWLPTAIVPATSTDGDKVFDELRTSGILRPLSASWLAAAGPDDLRAGLSLLVGRYEEWIAGQRGEAESLPSEAQRSQAERHLEVCGEAAERIRGATAALVAAPEVRQAFQLAQEAMVTQRRWSEGDEDLHWRPFQLAFQLLALESLADRTHGHRRVMDLLWFPTGGGKTEAYLALTAFILILRRLRRSEVDNGEGVGAFMRYTLRLLTIQQFQRATAVICACELIRRTGRLSGTVELGDAPISIGLWVGNATTPGTLADARKLQAGSPTTYKQLTSCPCCRGPLGWSLSNNADRVQCTSDGGCEFAETGRSIPAWTIDEDIYRERPSLIIGTVDKFAQIVRKADAAFLFALNEAHAPPDLIIQDELHLISGPLGSVTGLYEAAIDELCAHRGARPKIIGSTATIRRARNQIRSLFNRQTFQFPPPGLDARNSCFAADDSDAPGRCYLGVTTAGHSAKFAVQAVSAAMLQAASTQGDSAAERDPYWTLVGYFNTLRELGGSLALMQDDVPIAIRQYAARYGETAREISPPAELTSRVSSYEIRAMLDELGVGCDQPGCHDVLLASNMISVGVDIPRLGVMLVVGQPKTISEYIQATSRVGRGVVPGLVVALYNSARVRDRAHFETFSTWHRTLYREVESTSVTPFASRSQDKALHAALVALVRHLIPGMRMNPTLSQAARHQAQALADRLTARAQDVSSAEARAVARKLDQLLSAWENQGPISRYWDDYGNSTSLLMSAEQFAASVQAGGGAARALWPTPNSMREVEPGTPFVLVEGLTSDGPKDG